jgi:hypothetical protein
MAANPTPRAWPELSAAALRLAAGARRHQDAIGIRQNTEATVLASLDACRQATEQLGTARAAHGHAIRELASAEKEIRRWLGTARRVLSLRLGDRWDSRWESSGFPRGSTAVPKSQIGRLNLCAALADFLSARPELACAAWSVTSAGARAKHQLLAGTRADFVRCRAEAVAQNRRFKTLHLKLCKRARGLIGELELLLDDADPRWLDFGLNIPARPAPPEPVQRLDAIPNGPRAVQLAWPRARRATRYRVFARPAAQPDAPAREKTVHDLRAILEDLPWIGELQLWVQAANAAGESAPGPVTTVRL